MIFQPADKQLSDSLIFRYHDLEIPITVRLASKTCSCLSRGSPYLLCGCRAVEDQQNSGADVYGQSNDGDEVRGDPGGNPAH